jgi:carbon-monoxide dehydrogenase medium subunit
MVGFAVARPTDVDGALAAIADGGPGTKLLAGGTDLLIQLRFGALHPRALVDLSGVTSLRVLDSSDGGLRIGAGATISDIELSPDVVARFPALREAAETLGSRQIRNVATVAGNICHSSPSAEFAPPLIALRAVAHIRSVAGERSVPLEDFAVGPGQNVLEPGEMLTEIRLPAPPQQTGAAYDCLKIRKIMDIAVVSAAAAITLDGLGVCDDVRLVLGAVAGVPLRATRAEQMLRGQRLTPEVLQAAARVAGDEAEPITDVRATREYRQAMIVRSAVRALTVARERAGAERR